MKDGCRQSSCISVPCNLAGASASGRRGVAGRELFRAGTLLAWPSIKKLGRASNSIAEYYDRCMADGL